jgi:predicted ester cyclase
MTPDIKWHSGTLGAVEGRENFSGLISAIVSALPGLHNVEQDIIAERDIVAVRAVVEGTHKGDLLGIPASGRHVRWDAVDVYRVANGKIAEEWAADDLLAFFRLRSWGLRPSLALAAVVVAQTEVDRLPPVVYWMELGPGSPS